MIIHNTLSDLISNFWNCPKGGLKNDFGFIICSGGVLIKPNKMLLKNLKFGMEVLYLK